MFLTKKKKVNDEQSKFVLLMTRISKHFKISIQEAEDMGTIDTANKLLDELEEANKEIRNLQMLRVYDLKDENEDRAEILAMITKDIEQVKRHFNVTDSWDLMQMDGIVKRAKIRLNKGYKS